MLYQHRWDPGENVNVSQRPENRETVRRLAGELHQRMGKDRSDAN